VAQLFLSCCDAISSDDKLSNFHKFAGLTSITINYRRQRFHVNGRDVDVVNGGCHIDRCHGNNAGADTSAPGALHDRVPGSVECDVRRLQCVDKCQRHQRRYRTRPFRPDTQQEHAIQVRNSNFTSSWPNTEIRIGLYNEEAWRENACYRHYAHWLGAPWSDKAARCKHSFVDILLQVIGLKASFCHWSQC